MRCKQEGAVLNRQWQGRSRGKGFGGVLLKLKEEGVCILRCSSLGEIGGLDWKATP